MSDERYAWTVEHARKTASSSNTLKSCRYFARLRVGTIPCTRSCLIPGDGGWSAICHRTPPWTRSTCSPTYADTSSPGITPPPGSMAGRSSEDLGLGGRPPPGQPPAEQMTSSRCARCPARRVARAPTPDAGGQECPRAGRRASEPSGRRVVGHWRIQALASWPAARLIAEPGHGVGRSTPPRVCTGRPDRLLIRDRSRPPAAGGRAIAQRERPDPAIAAWGIRLRPSRPASIGDLLFVLEEPGRAAVCVISTDADSRTEGYEKRSGHLCAATPTAGLSSLESHCPCSSLDSQPTRRLDVEVPAPGSARWALVRVDTARPSLSLRNRRRYCATRCPLSDCRSRSRWRTQFDHVVHVAQRQRWTA